jgi:PST family polysaccharide transporter
MNQNKTRYIFFFNTASILYNSQGIIRSKLISLWLGVKALGALGQMISLYSLQTQLTSFGIDTLLINKIGKIDAVRENARYSKIIIFSFSIILITNLIVFLLLFLFRISISLWLFGSEEYEYIIRLMAILNPIYSISYILESITQSHKFFKKLAIGRNLSNFIGLVSIGPFIWFWGLRGVVFNFYFFLLVNSIYFSLIIRKVIKDINFRSFKFDKELIIELLHFCAIDTLRKITVFASLIIFRIFIVQFSGIENNGYFQSIWSISNYLNVFIASFIVYFFPTASSAFQEKKIKNVLNENFEFLIYMLFPFAAIIMLIPEIFLKFLFTSEFIFMSYPLIIFTFLKLFNSAYYFYTISFLSQTRLKYFLTAELIRGVFLIIFSYFAIKSSGLNGAILSIILMEIVSFLVVINFARREKIFHLSQINIRLYITLVSISTLLLVPNFNSIVLRIIKSILFISLSLIVLDIKKYYRLFTKIIRLKI